MADFESAVEQIISPRCPSNPSPPLIIATQSRRQFVQLNWKQVLNLLRLVLHAVDLISLIWIFLIQHCWFILEVHPSQTYGAMHKKLLDNIESLNISLKMLLKLWMIYFSGMSQSLLKKKKKMAVNLSHIPTTFM